MTARSSYRDVLNGLAGLACVAAAMELAVRVGWLNPSVIAPPSSLPEAFGYLWREGEGLEAFLLTVAQAGAATAIAFVVGLPLGVLLWRRRTLRDAFEPWLAALFAAPLILLYPLFLVIFGRGYATSIFVGTVIAVVPIALKTREGLSAVPLVLINVGRTFGVSGAKLFRQVTLPAATPTIFSGVRLGMIYALVNIMGIEFLTDFGGLGRIVSDMYFQFRTPEMYAAIILIVIASALILFAVRRVERWLRAA